MDHNLLEEIRLLLLFSQQSTYQGIKIHSNASQADQAAACRLFEKGLITQLDGGYLTDRGVEAVDHSQHLVALLNN